MTRFAARAGATCLLAASCGGPPQQPPAGPPEATPDRIVIGVRNTVNSVSPTEMSSEAQEVLARISEPVLDYEFDCRLTFRPGLVAAWASSADGRVVSTVIDERARWSDGQPVRADDLLRVKGLLPRDPLLEAPPEAVGDRVVLWRYRPGAVEAARLFAFAPLMLGTRDGTPTGPVTGPWRLAGDPTPDGVTLVPNPAWPGPTPGLCAAELKVIADPSARVLALLRGDVDLLTDLEVSEIDAIRVQAPHIRFLERPPRAYEFVAWNRSRGPLASRGVRRALTGALDLAAIRAAVMTDSAGVVWAEPAYGSVSPSLCGTAHSSLQAIPFDAAASAAALEAEGWRDADGDGVRELDGQPLRLTLLVNPSLQRRTRTADHLRRALGAVGVELVIEEASRQAIEARVDAGDFDAALLGQSAKLWLDPSAQWRSVDGGGLARLNPTRWGDATTDGMLDAILSAPTSEQAVSRWHELQVRVYEDQPVTFLWWVHEAVAVHPRFTDVPASAISPYRRLERWGVTAGEAKRPCPTPP